MTRVRVRGIYATALTEFLREDYEIVDASDPIDRRFETSFATAEPDVTVRTTGDRLGVGLLGSPDGASAIESELVGIARDALRVVDPATRGAIFEATVTETLGSGAVVDLGPREGFLPFDATDDHVREGDTYRVQVHDPAPPWANRRPVVGTRIKALGELADLVRGGDAPRADVPDRERASELVRTTEALPVDVPEGWSVRWNPPAADAGVDALGDALDRLRDRAEAIETHRGGDDPPEHTSWIRFGRESRFELDGRRRTVVPTMAGHHRIKAGDETASAAVDFVERLGDPPTEFPFEAVVDQFGPEVGDEVEIEHGKPDGRSISLGRGEVTDCDDWTVTVRRQLSGGGEYDALDAPKEDGDVAITRLREGRWWYPTTYRGDDGETKGTYVNVCTPVEVFPRAARYVDLYVDVVRDPDGSVRRVDEAELTAAVERGAVPEPLATRAREVASAVESALS